MEESTRANYDAGPYQKGDYVTLVVSQGDYIVAGTVLEAKLVEKGAIYPITAGTIDRKRVSYFHATELRYAAPEEILAAKLTQ